MYVIVFHIINSDFVLIKSTILDLFGKSNVLLCLEYINLNLPLSPVLALYIPLTLQFCSQKYLSIKHKHLIREKTRWFIPKLRTAHNTKKAAANNAVPASNW
jgi:hypothetical protein